jgi:enediyne biosynthesis protein E4
LSLVLGSEKTMRRRVWTLAIGLAAVFAAWFTVRAVESWRFKAELRQAQLDLSARRFGPARARLSRLAQRWPDHGEVEYLLGACEMAKGHTDAAMAAWGRVPDQAPQAPVALLSRGRLALDTGHYGLAETCLDRASRMGGDHANEARRLLARVHWITGRHDEYRSFLRREFDHTRDPYETLRVLWSLDHEPYPIEGMRQTLEKARLIAPDDDRIWLALAGLATRSGRVDEAGELLARCERVQPDDSAVWRARLEWAQAANRPDELMRAAKHLPASGVPKGQLLTISAWLAARRGDRRAEREALEQLVDLEPEQAAGFERLADLATQDGAMARFAELRRRKAESDSARDRYATLVHQLDPAPPAAELARTAEALGRRFDAQAWWKLAARRDQASRGEAEAALARLAKAEPESAPVGRTLGDLLGPLPTPRNGKTDVPVALSVPAFTDDAERRGLAFIFDNGRTDLRQLPETMSGGVALLDFDGDGWLDIYAVGGGPFPPAADRPLFGDRLFRNRGDGRFEDVTAASGLAALSGGYGHGVAVGDYDNDGRPDLFVTRWRSYALYHNLGAGRFEDTTASTGLGGDRDWPTSAAWADLDSDGDLDLYVCHYLQWDPATTAPCHRLQRPEYTYCNPRSFRSLPDHLFRNDRGRFVDVTAETGIVDPDGRGLGVVAADLDDDGKTDLFVANDTSANYYFHNRGGLRFVEEGVAAGLATNAGGGYLAGMGVARGDIDGDGRLDLAVTNFFGESTTLYHNHGRGLFSDRSAAAGLATPTRFVLGFGIVALDANNDGRLDLAQANGHVEDYLPTIPYAMPSQLFLGDAAGRLTDVSGRAGAPWQVPRLGRGMAAGDLDNDGRIDLLLVAENNPLAMLVNRYATQDHPQAESANHFIMLGLEGTASNRDAVGARVTVTVSGRAQIAERFGGGSYLSASDPRLHFGLGPALVADRVEVRWPSGHRDSYQGVAADAGYRLVEGDPVPRPLAGFSFATSPR